MTMMRLQMLKDAPSDDLAQHNWYGISNQPAHRSNVDGLLGVPESVVSRESL